MIALKKFFVLFLVAVLILSGCSKDEKPVPEISENPEKEPETEEKTDAEAEELEEINLDE